jgi:hypothetical protein
MKFVKYLLFISFFFLLGFHAVQRSFKIIPQKKLNGVYDSTSSPVLTIYSYFTRRFQPLFETVSEEKMGFRPSLIRTINQLDYSLFRYPRSGYYVIGKNEMLYTEPYITNFKGITFKGIDRIKDEVRRLKIIQDELQRHNVGFLIIFAPGKASFYPEYIPDHFKKRPITNYQVYSKSLTGSGINFIDMNAWFMKLKGKTSYPLYALNASHWNSYGVGLAADSMFRYIRKLKNMDLPDFSWDTVLFSDSIRYRENDISDLLNLWVPIKQPPVPYPHFVYNTVGKVRPKVISIGDSYWFGFMDEKITSKVFNGDHYWYYFKNVVEDGNWLWHVNYADLKSELFSQDLVILITTESNYQDFPFGFIEEFFEKCLPDSPERTQIELDVEINKIKSDTEWYKFEVQKAKEQGLSIDKVISIDAQYMMGLEKNK